MTVTGHLFSDQAQCQSLPKREKNVPIPIMFKCSCNGASISLHISLTIQGRQRFPGSRSSLVKSSISFPEQPRTHKTSSRKTHLTCQRRSHTWPPAPSPKSRSLTNHACVCVAVTSGKRAIRLSYSQPARTTTAPPSLLPLPLQRQLRLSDASIRSSSPSTTPMWRNGRRECCLMDRGYPKKKKKKKNGPKCATVFEASRPRNWLRIPRDKLHGSGR